MKASLSPHERPHSAGEYFYQPGTWGTLTPKNIKGGRQKPERLFFASGQIVRAQVDELSASGRLCRALRQGGSLHVPGFRDWEGRWVKVGECPGNYRVLAAV